MALTKIKTGSVSDSITLTAPTVNGGTHTAFTSTGIDDNATSTAITIDASENVGIGVTPEAWNSAYTVLQTGGTGAQWSNDAQAAGSIFDQGQNIYRDASAEKYIVTDEASKYRQYSGTHIFQVAPSGTADAAISWTTAMTIDNGGRVTQPYQPAFFAYRSGNYSAIAQNEKVEINVKDYDIGSNYSTANARFTAPVAGRYFFTGNVNCYAVIIDQYMMATLVINGSSKVYGNRIPSRNSGDWNVTVSGVVNMAVGDYAELWSHSGDSARNLSAGAWNTFSGFLIG